MNAIPHRIAPIAPPHSTAFVQLHSGACVDLLAPDFGPVSLTDIATSLSRLARFNGATRGAQPYSVAQHSILVMQILEQRRHNTAMLRAGLLHDAHEAVLGDIATPVKAALGRDAVREVEARLQTALALRFGLPPLIFASNWALHQADQVALATERRDLLNPSAWPWPTMEEEALPDTILQPWPASRAHVEWLTFASRLGLR